MESKYFINAIVIDKKYNLRIVIDNTYSSEDKKKLLINTIAIVPINRMQIQSFRPKEIEIDYLVGKKRNKITVKGSLFFANFAEEMKTGQILMRIGIGIGAEHVLEGELLLDEANQQDNNYLLLDMYMICDKNLKVIYKNETMTAEDIAIAFEIIEECGLEISEVN